MGEVEADGKVLVIRRIKQTFHLTVPEEQRETVERVLSVYADSCPVARSVKGSIEISSGIEYVST
ncbi:MAG: hypothetical protein AVDCRST_MAG03-3175 [uncultured Rubrobacteraceae bacterium]|uniref:OsmC-like protein n=1 Tax=uncultured Rubrobacteraceae bacterium TaxID=349277 RepID=A0A6J4Q7I7_9ACTN|nr:MAG: hypothetical protein AVDCRST_MAG03-3175 [uncultured Rubrobacteraceae bacterium]